MTDSYKVGYSVDAFGDLREIYSYIANELLVPEAAAAQLGRIRKEVDDEERAVTVARIFYGGRDIEGVINSNK